MAAPKVSVVMVLSTSHSPTKRRPVLRAAESLLTQTFQDFELIVVYERRRLRLPNDVASNLGEIYSLLSGRVRTYRMEPGTPKAAKLAHGVSKASATKIVEMSEFDICHPLRLELHLRELDLHPESRVHLAAPIFFNHLSGISATTHFLAYPETAAYRRDSDAGGATELLRVPLVIRSLHYFGIATDSFEDVLGRGRDGMVSRYPLPVKSQQEVLRIMGEMEDVTSIPGSQDDVAAPISRDWNRALGDGYAVLNSMLTSWPAALQVLRHE